VNVPVRRILLAVATFLLTAAGLATGATGASAATSSPVRYVALGDSYSAGTGAGSYAPAARSCERSARAFPQLWASRHAHASFVSVACAGATTASVRTSQLTALSRRTTLVSLTVGGNDVGFSSVMQACVLELKSACLKAIATAESSIRTVLPARLDSLLRAVRARAPRARIVLLGYPDLYDLSQSGSCIGIGTAKRTALDQGAAVLDQVLSAAAARTGAHYVDVRARFAGHEICDASASYLNALSYPLDTSYHPNAAGQQYGYLPAFTAAQR
jgi:lysophospholipase L1-like esterase